MGGAGAGEVLSLRATVAALNAAALSYQADLLVRQLLPRTLCRTCSASPWTHPVRGPFRGRWGVVGARSCLPHWGL
jgi:hypothetical protein